MFSGIVQDVVTIIAIKPIPGGRQVDLTLPKAEQYLPGDSILLNGICSTVVHVGFSDLVVEYMAQTDRLTTSSLWQSGDKINCEAPLTLQTKISGSLVTGHVDTVATVELLLGPSDDRQLVITFDVAVPASVMPQGSITIDGVNLTIAAVISQTQIAVHIIPHTWQHTIMQYYRASSKVNIEFDYIAKLFLARVVS